uniref:Dihydrolipoamide dehydrogenase-like protein n=8 Tax=Bacteria TaxID=2 RepID=Q6SKC7_PAEAU|nr:dihydrolipoamide dehydrogenase-like protein [Paenarthrobacter aurescens]AET43039.1 dihyrolipoamide dehydrogenase-like protein [Pseudomonas sp. ADP]
MAKMRKVTTVRGYGAFVGANHLEVEETTGTGQEKTGTKKVIAFKRAIIAAGSQAVRLPFMPNDPRVVDSTGALALSGVPKRMLILGGGIIGLEMGTVYSTLGARLDVVEMMDGLMQGADRDLVKIWQKMNAKRFDNIMLKTKTVGAEATPEGIKVTFAPAEEGGTTPEPQVYDLVLQAVGRTPNGKKIAAEKAGVAVTDRGFINVDIQMRTNVPHIFAIGDIVGQPMLAHKAVHEAHVAAEVIAGELQGNKELASAAFNARVIPSVAYTDPEVAWVGLTEDQAKAQGIKVKKGLFPWTASGRAIANGRDEGFTKLLFDDSPEAATPRISSPGVIFHAATGIDAATVAPVQTTLQKRILRAFVARGLLENCDAKDMLGYKHSGFSVDAGVCIEAHDRAALERLLRYCARPPFSMERLRKEGSKLVYRCAKQRSEPTSDKRGAKADELHLTPLELIDRIAALVPPPRTHRHRYFGVLAPNSPLRAAVTALAQPAASQPATVETAQPGAGVPGVAAPGNAATPTPEPEARPKRAAHYLWAVLIARIYEAFPLLCPMCGGQMRIIAFITHSAEIRHILNHIGVESAPPHITPARGPPLWEGCDAPVDDGAQGEPDWDLAAQPDEVDQRVNW